MEVRGNIRSLREAFTKEDSKYFLELNTGEVNFVQIIRNSLEICEESM